MSQEPVILVENISKAYRIWGSPADRLLSPMQSGLAGLLPANSAAAQGLQKRAASTYRDFYALRDISFSVTRGESVGIIGRNGSGKSTLLQIIAGTLQPTSGRAKVNGRVAALLELGSGFNPEFTGRENVYLNAGVLGLSRQEVDKRFDQIAAFADIGEFIEEPVKIYSSGMVMRLAFAVCAHVDAEILIIDEALGVGDARFQLKCARTIDGFLAKGCTLLFVSHDVSAVKRLCSHALLLEQGRMLYKGNPNTVVNVYTKLLANPSAAAIADDIKRLSAESADGPAAAVAAPQISSSSANGATSSVEVAALRGRLAQIQAQLESIAAAALPQMRADALLANERSGQHPASDEYAYGGEAGEILQRSMAGADGAEKLVFTAGETVRLRIRVRARAAIADPIYALTIKSSKGQEVYGTNTHFIGQPAPPIAAGQEAEVDFQFPLNLVAGEYFVSLGWTYFRGDEIVVIHRRYDTLKFMILAVDRTFGVAHLFAKIEVRPDPAPLP